MTAGEASRSGAGATAWSGALLARRGGLVAVDKPPGVTVIPARGEDPARCLRAQLEGELGQKVWVVHRLDRDTSGVVVFATDAKAHRALSMAFERGQVRKRYHALVQGRLAQALTVDAPIASGRKGKMRVARPGEEGKAASTRFRALELFADATLVEAEPKTGRTHQLRVHLAHAGHPLLVDPLYGAPGPWHLGAATLARTPLHAAWLELPQDCGGLTLESPVPQDFAAALAALRAATAPA